MAFSITVQASQPNLVIFYVDDLGYGDLGTYGHLIAKTPNIDQLATDGIKFLQYYAPAPLCSPSRAAMLTGRTPYHTGVRSWISPGQDLHIGENEVTIAHLLQAKGYKTAVMGKLHLNGGAEMKDQPQPDDLGFDYSFVIPGGWVKNAKIAAPAPGGKLRSGKMYPDNFWRNGEPVGETSQFSGDLVTDEVIQWLDQLDGESPFFLYIPYSEVHTPVASPDRYLEMYSDYISESAKQTTDVYYFDRKNLPYRGNGEYYANITYLDEQVGRVIRKLEDMGKTDETVIIFTSDNGPVTREYRKPWEIGMAGETAGLRGRKDNLLEGGIRVPAIIKYPPLVASGQVSNEPVHGVDLLPTLAELLNFELPSDRELDGQSITATFRGEGIERDRPLIWTIDMAGEDDPVSEWAIRDGDWKLLLDQDEKPKFLFNIADDPHELYNLLDKNDEILASMMQQFVEYRENIENDSINKAREIGK